jgi:8-amino-7-oxononanoate synthase
MLDFASALYLGLKHPSQNLRAWQQLTLGKPAALDQLPRTLDVERKLAALVGCDRALLAPSTLHIFCDLFPILARPGTVILLDGSSYPIARWGVERTAALGVPVRVLPKFDPHRIGRAVATGGGLKPVFVTDGFDPDCACFTPIRLLIQQAKAVGGSVVIDDTQALGIWGRHPTIDMPYGNGGGGLLQHAGIQNDEIILVSSLAKGFGVPVAMLAGDTKLIEEFEAKSATRVHCSPPSAAVIEAAAAALEINERNGEELRGRLAARVRQFRRGLAKLGIPAGSTLFPVQTIRFPQGVEVGALYEALLQRGVQTVLRGANEADSCISFVLNAGHELGEIDKALNHLTDALAPRLKQNSKGLTGNDNSTQFSSRTVSRI